MLIFIEDPCPTYPFTIRKPLSSILDLLCLIFHLCHFTFRLYLRATPSDSLQVSISGKRTNLKGLIIKTRRILPGRTEQFEAFALLVAVVLVTDNIRYIVSDFTSPRYSRLFRVIFLVDSIQVLKRLMRNCLSSLIALREVLLLGLAIISFFSLTAIIVWPPESTAEGATHFYSIHRSVMVRTIDHSVPFHGLFGSYLSSSNTINSSRLYFYSDLRIRYFRFGEFPRYNVACSQRGLPFYLFILY